MLSPRRNSLLLLCLLLVGCQKIDLTEEPTDAKTTGATQQATTIVGTGEGTRECPYTPADVRALTLSGNEPVWVAGYVVGTARLTMKNAVFSPEAENQSNILLASDSLCTDIDLCIPVELGSEKWKNELSVPTNKQRFRKCLLLKAFPSTYLNRKGLRSISAGLWMEWLDLSSVAPQEWGKITL